MSTEERAAITLSPGLNQVEFVGRFHGDEYKGAMARIVVRLLEDGSLDIVTEAGSCPVIAPLAGNRVSLRVMRARGDW